MDGIMEGRVKLLDCGFGDLADLKGSAARLGHTTPHAVAQSPRETLVALSNLSSNKRRM